MTGNNRNANYSREAYQRRINAFVERVANMRVPMSRERRDNIETARFLMLAEIIADAREFYPLKGELTND